MQSNEDRTKIVLGLMVATHKAAAKARNFGMYLGGIIFPITMLLAIAWAFLDGIVDAIRMFKLDFYPTVDIREEKNADADQPPS